MYTSFILVTAEVFPVHIVYCFFSKVIPTFHPPRFIFSKEFTRLSEKMDSTDYLLCTSKLQNYQGRVKIFKTTNHLSNINIFPPDDVCDVSVSLILRWDFLIAVFQKHLHSFVTFLYSELSL